MMMRSLAILVAGTVLSCASGGWSHSSEELVSELSCGMRISEVEHLAREELQPVTSVAFQGVYGTHTLERDNTTVWLHFKEGRLQAFARWRPDAWKLKSIRISPKENLCNGAVTFFLRLFRPQAFDEATVYLDGKKLEEFEWARPFEVPAGRHELRVENQGYEPIIRNLDLDEDDSGELWLDLTQAELHSLSR